MDENKCKALKAELALQPEPLLVSVPRFFDGNDDPGSIGCNLTDHPGVTAFHDVFTALLRRSDVSAVLVGISELDPGEGSWPFADTIFVAGTIPKEALREAVHSLQPDEIGGPDELNIPPALIERYESSVWALWWD